MTEITVRYLAVDGASKTRRFATVRGARKFAISYVGETPEIGSFYAVSGDGIGRVTVKGCTLAELFTGPAKTEMVALYNEDSEAPTEYAPKTECAEVVVDGDWETIDHGHSRFNPITGWIRKSALASYERKVEDYNESLGNEIPF